MATTSRIAPPQLQALAQQLKDWRAARNPGQRIPEELWNAAAEVARVEGLNRTATTLKLNYYYLQRRLSDHCPSRSQRVPATAFVELPPPSLPGRDESGALELVKSSGTRLTLRLPSASPTDLLAVVHLFLEHCS